MTTAPVGERDAALEKEWQAMRDALAHVVMNWAKIDTALAGLLDVLLDVHIGTTGSVIYYALSNMESRIKIIDSVLHFRLWGSIIPLR